MKVNAKQLLDRLKTASQFAGQKSTLPVLSFVWWTSTPNKTLALCSTNLEGGVVVETGFPLDEQFPADGFCVPAKAMLELLSYQSDVLELKYTERTGKLHIAGGGSKTDLACLPGSEFPPFQNSAILGKQPAIHSAEYTVNAIEFATALEHVTVAASRDDSRPVLMGVYLEAKPGKLALSCADGFRLAHNEISCNATKKDGALVMADNLSAASRFLRPTEVEILVGSGIVILRQPEIEFFLTRIEGSFPDYMQIAGNLPGAKNAFWFDRNELRAALKRARIVVSDARILRLTVTADEIRVDTQNEALGQFSEAIQHIQKPELDIPEFIFAVNIDLFVNALEKCPDVTKLFAEINSDTTPLYLTAGEKAPDWFHVIMPMHLGS